jgi:O-antigen ligase
VRPELIAAESREEGAGGSLRARLAGPALGFSLNGFFVYLGALAAVGIEPRTALTGAYYGLLGVALLALAWPGRRRIAARIDAGGRTAAVFAASAALLAAWFLASAALLSDGTAPSRRFAAQLLFWTVPSVLLALSLNQRQLVGALWTVAGLGLLFVLVDVVALLVPSGEDLGDRFSPIPDLDPITAAQIPALGAVALVCLSLRDGRLAAGRLAALFVLAAFAVIPGSRGPLAALAVGSVAVLALAWRRTGPLVIAALVLGAAAGALIATEVGSERHLTSELSSSGSGDTAPISSLNIRKQLLEKAVRAVPDAPLLGNGVGTLVDDTPEARRMGIAGRATYPHNNFVEAIYSLGAFGLALYAAAVAAAAWALVQVARRARDALAVFGVAFFAFAFVSSNMSGELGADAWLWTAAALGVALLGTRRRREAVEAP